MQRFNRCCPSDRFWDFTNGMLLFSQKLQREITEGITRVPLSINFFLRQMWEINFFQFSDYDVTLGYVHPIWYWKRVKPGPQSIAAPSLAFNNCWYSCYFFVFIPCSLECRWKLNKSNCKSDKYIDLWRRSLSRDPQCRSNNSAKIATWKICYPIDLRKSREKFSVVRIFQISLIRAVITFFIFLGDSSYDCLIIWSRNFHCLSTYKFGTTRHENTRRRRHLCYVHSVASMMLEWAGQYLFRAPSFNIRSFN